MWAITAVDKRTRFSLSDEHRRIGGATPKFLDGPNLRPTTDVLQAICGVSHNIGIEEWDKQKSLCDVCNLQQRVKDDFEQIFKN